MLKHLLLTTVAAALLAGVGYAQKPTITKVTIPLTRTAPNNGKLMYGNYCAPCHGIDGKGNGPVSPALKTPATDLTRLSQANRGKFPSAHMAAVLEFGTTLQSHGTAQMPVWGRILGKMSTPEPEQTSLRISNLSRYVETLQMR